MRLNDSMFVPILEVRVGPKALKQQEFENQLIMRIEGNGETDSILENRTIFTNYIPCSNVSYLLPNSLIEKNLENKFCPEHPEKIVFNQTDETLEDQYMAPRIRVYSKCDLFQNCTSREKLIFNNLGIRVQFAQMTIDLNHYEK